MAQASFFYYNPESGSDSRQHDLFTPQPSAILKSSPMPQDANLHNLHMLAMARSMPQKSSLLSHEPQVLSVETEFTGFEELSYPRTPDLSSTSSAVSSPPHSSYLPTPTNGFFESLTGVKEGCEHDVKSEILASFDFSRAGSPPLTPVFVNPPNVTAANASHASELLSTSSCPSLSPSPSPAPQQQFVSQQPENFCDPRNLLVSSKSTPLINQLDIPTLPAFIPSNDDLLLGCAPAKGADSAALEPLPPVVDSVPFFDSFSDLDSETDFITDLSQDNTSLYAGIKRQRVDSIPFSEDLSESSFEEDWTTMTPITESADKPVTKKQKLDDNVDFDFASNFASGNNTEAADVTVSGSTAQDGQETPIAPAGDSNTPSQQANRRGRKQSLTDDPSKTFVCTLCSRRFRRQEHLKRHYRSLHTQDKPFECSDCGKKFSRSDNLAQHARTHGNTTIVGINMPEIDEKTASMSAHLFETAAAISSSSSSNGSDDEKAAKKRKRDE